MMKTLKAHKVTFLVAAIVILLMFNIFMLEDSFAKYRSAAVVDKNSSVLEFDPEIGGFEDFDGFLSPGANGDNEIPCKFKSAQDVDTNVIVIVTTEGELPYVYTIELEDGTILEGEKDGNVYTFEFFVPKGERPKFTVKSRWNAPNYDERFNQLSESFNIKIICEQDEEG